jgi:L-iduronidase
MNELTTIRVDAARSTGRLDHFWRSTGFSPAELLLEPEMRQTLTFLAGVPNNGVRYLRVHYLLNLVRATRSGAKIRYDWSLLDQGLDIMLAHRMAPIFEIMGNPSDIFTDLQDMDQVKLWRDMVAELAERYLARYGKAELDGWYFETWNEPDVGWWAFGEQGLRNYFDATEAGLHDVDADLKFGGPGTARTLSPMFKVFFEHIDKGTHCLTGEKPLRLDFISVHEKGVRKNIEDVTPNTLGICHRELQAVAYLKEHHPRLADLPLINDECDPQIGWSQNHTWCALPYAAALMAKIIDQHQRVMIDQEKLSYPILSNDNGFMGTWGRRTHCTYFGDKEFSTAQSKHKTDLSNLVTETEKAIPFELVKKPALTVMEIMALLGEERCEATVGPRYEPDVDGLGIVPTKTTDGGVSILLYNSIDRIFASGHRTVRLSVDGLKDVDHALAVFRIDDEHGNPFAVWEPVAVQEPPTVETFQAMRAAQEPALLHPIAVMRPEEGRISLDLSVPLPSLSQIVAIPRGAQGPAVPKPTKLDRYPGLHGQANAMLLWESGGVATVELFDVFVGPSAAGPFRKINPTPLLASAFLHAGAEKGSFYVIQARDMFARTSAFSEPLAF